jgi:predicted nucleotidyltransferase
MTDFEALLRRLTDDEVDFILVGGVAATVHGSTRLTQDLDVVYGRSVENIERLVLSLTDLAPYPRGAPPGLPFEWSEATVRAGLNFTLITRLGDFDLLGEIVGGGTFEELLEDTIPIAIFGSACLCLTLDKLIEVKRAAGRPRDFEAVAELEAIREERSGTEPTSP